MELLRLRTLTEKSTLVNFGNMSIRQRTVEWCLNNERSKWDLIYAYYNKSKISFTDSVLDKLMITSKWRIIKPGVNNELYVLFRDSHGGYEIQLSKAQHGSMKNQGFRLHEAEKKERLSKSALRDFNRKKYNLNR